MYLILYIFYVVTLLLIISFYSVLVCLISSFLSPFLTTSPYTWPFYFYFFYNLTLTCFVLFCPFYFCTYSSYPPSYPPPIPQYFCLRYTCQFPGHRLLLVLIQPQSWFPFTVCEPLVSTLDLRFCTEDRDSRFPRSQATQQLIPEGSNLRIWYCSDLTSVSGEAQVCAVEK
jgi:hypothetical protein